MGILRQIHTGKDNITYDVVRVYTSISVIVGLCLEVFVIVCHKQPFNLTEFGLGIGAVFASAGAALKLKESTEP